MGIEVEEISKKKSGSNPLFPVFLKAEELEVLLIGGGNVALEKLNALLSNSPKASVHIVAKAFGQEISALIEGNENITLSVGAAEEIHFVGKQLVISAVNDIETSAALREWAHKHGALYNAADKPEYCDFYLGSVVSKGALKLAISTNGQSPTIAKRLREMLQVHIPNEIDDSLTNLHELRVHLKGDFKTKVNQLNKITQVLTERKTKAWYEFSFQRVFAYVGGVLGIMLAGHLLFSLVPLRTIWGSTNELIAQLDVQFLYFMLGGFIAQMIDGALGMAYGVSATTFLLSFGVSPAVASMSVHTSEIFTSGVSGFLHLRFGNVNSKLFKSIVIPGVIGSILGAYILSEFEEYNKYIKPIVGVYTLTLGIVIISKVIKKQKSRKKVTKVGWLATAGGFLDAIGGGGWGPVVSSTLIARGKSPRMIIGSVNLAEFFVSLASSFTFFTLIGTSHWQTILGLILGGVVAAPLAAYMSRRLNVKAMMLMVGIVVVIVSLRIILLTLFG